MDLYLHAQAQRWIFWQLKHFDASTSEENVWTGLDEIECIFTQTMEQSAEDLERLLLRAFPTVLVLLLYLMGWQYQKVTLWNVI